MSSKEKEKERENAMHEIKKSPNVIYSYYHEKFSDTLHLTYHSRQVGMPQALNVGS